MIPIQFKLACSPWPVNCRMLGLLKLNEVMRTKYQEESSRDRLSSNRDRHWQRGWTVVQICACLDSTVTPTLRSSQGDRHEVWRLLNPALSAKCVLSLASTTNKPGLAPNYLYYLLILFTTKTHYHRSGRANSFLY